MNAPCCFTPAVLNSALARQPKNRRVRLRSVPRAHSRDVYPRVVRTPNEHSGSTVNSSKHCANGYTLSSGAHHAPEEGHNESRPPIVRQPFLTW